MLKSKNSIRMKHRYRLSIIQLVIIFSHDQLQGTAAVGQYGANATKPAELNYVVSLTYNDYKESPYQGHFCTGTLVTNKLVLTSHHCGLECYMRNCLIRIRSGDFRNTITYHFKKWISYIDWAVEKNKPIDSHTDNLVLIELKEIVMNIRPAVVRTVGFKIQSGSSAFMAGWDIQNNTSNQDVSALKLRIVPLEVIPQEKCEERVKEHPQFAELDWNKLICTTKLNVDHDHALLTNVDEGGPVFDRQFDVVGVNRGSTPLFYSKGSRVDQMYLHSSIKFYGDFLRKIMYKNFISNK